ncbi:hypothetical protein LCGC14_2645090 [marine sediment metagenome]|uniref:Moybdenum cofactor oxidoreductase dimerisation domain-containing protein n=1 Tax=marine sediment metagenome TaxID=412755 RepID=A0A0F9C6W8_9ZZZZ
MREKRNTGKVFEELQAYIQVTFPAGGENLQPGVEYNITWASAGVERVSIELSLDNGQNWTIIDGDVSAAEGTYGWVIAEGIDSSECRVKISDVAGVAFVHRSLNQQRHRFRYDFVELGNETCGGEVLADLKDLEGSLWVPEWSLFGRDAT